MTPGIDPIHRPSRPASDAGALALEIPASLLSLAEATIK
jgi:hypothetical protein